VDGTGLERLRTVPFWQEVLHTERRAGAIVGAFATTVDDPLVKKAVKLQGYEETRHAELLREMIRRYGIRVEELPLEPIGTDIETAFKLARQSGFLPETMFKIFETLMFEETRHIVFFCRRRNSLILWRSLRDSNSCTCLERAMS
jgi:tRNA isopentenyl-2-thiomethyl-A-37 hydroxylase MiaE